MQFTFKGAFKPKEGAKHPIYHTCHYINGEWFVKIGGSTIPIQLPDIKTATLLFSLPCNDKYPAWTKKKVKANTVKDIASKYWCPIYDKMKVRGHIEQNVFHITAYKYGK